MKNNSALRFQKDFSCKKSAKKILFFVALLLFFCALSIAFTSSILYENIAYAADKSEEEIKKEFEGDVNDVIDGLDLDAIQNFLNSLGENEKEAVSIDDLKATLKALVNGQTQSFYQNFLNLLSKSAGRCAAVFVRILFAFAEEIGHVTAQNVPYAFLISVCKAHCRSAAAA